MTDISSNCSFWFWFLFLLAVQRQWDSSEQDTYIELPQFPDIRCAVKRLFSGTLQLPRLSCRPSMQGRPEDGPQSDTSAPGLKPSRSLGSLTSYISRDLWVNDAMWCCQYLSAGQLFVCETSFYFASLTKTLVKLNLHNLTYWHIAMCWYT